MPSTRYDTALRFVGAFESLSLSSLLACRTPDCAHIFLPSSLFVRPLDNTAFEAHISRLHGIIKTFPVTAKEIMEDEQQNRVIVWATSQPIFHDELKDEGLTEEEWTYKGEYMFILSMNESGDKVERVVEFVDSKGSERFLGLIQRARTNKEKRDKGGA